MTKICTCGKEFEVSGRRHTRCPECAYERLKGKVRERMHGVRRELFGPLVKDRVVYQVTAKCPRCPDGHDRHTVEMVSVPSIMPRLFCSRHQILKSILYADAYNGTTVRV
jgi:DNA-directed RNA polymerase subunit RPC12/RpoP